MTLIIRKGAIQYLEHFLILFFSCFCYKFNIAIDTITLTQPINDPESIISSNNAFQLGFFNPVNTTNRYVGIWYNNIPVTTVVWVANRDRPLIDSSGTLMISKDGNLVVLNGKNEIIWSSNVSNSTVNSSARLLDSGNLVLVDNSNGMTIWGSFQYPSDVLLKNMTLSSERSTGKNILLKSWKSPSDPSIGSFSVGINILTIPEVFVWNGSLPYWRSGPWNGQILNRRPDMTSLYTYESQSMLIYIFLNHEGSLMEMVWTEGKQEPEVHWSSTETDCGVYGKCGPFGSCNAKESPICSCLRGFEPNRIDEWNSGNFTGGCVRRKNLQCERNDSSSQAIKKDGFLMLTTMKVPAFPGLSSVLANDCENQCLKNCSCTAYAYYEGIGCMLWSGSLIDIQKISSTGADLYIRVAYSELDKKRDLKLVIVISVIIRSIISFICAYFIWIVFVKQREYSTKVLFEDNLNQVELEELPLFKFEKLGKLPDGQEIAVKRLSRTSEQGLEEFMNEVVMISKLQHRNLVRLLGCCVEANEKMLVYEYMPNKSLDAFLFDPQKQKLLNWSKRFDIIEGIGRGLLYLHRDSRLRIIHRDLKASNILLDEELNPKISDFGMARIFCGNEHQANTRRVVGTYGYMSPEYAMQGSFSEKSDVFSFGVLLLEVVSGRRNTSFYDDEQSLSLLGYVRPLDSIAFPSSLILQGLFIIKI
ncbi:hypothetical protein TEA_018156 [Camellia sinensis var. sinensis]|uniref:Receptor-like serine/threonine-protein kinase n=1 Tax=Camellia sinensis var. sinensis TaxID=542762 RepID=A0A4S4DUE5_CAMSN|nr:hypothetical protein TEA_018156 [Camellia sinensis var. sinensis]